MSCKPLHNTNPLVASPLSISCMWVGYQLLVVDVCGAAEHCLVFCMIQGKKQAEVALACRPGACLHDGYQQWDTDPCLVGFMPCRHRGCHFAVTSFDSWLREKLQPLCFSPCAELVCSGSRCPLLNGNLFWLVLALGGNHVWLVRCLVRHVVCNGNHVWLVRCLVRHVVCNGNHVWLVRCLVRHVVCNGNHVWLVRCLVRRVFFTAITCDWSVAPWGFAWAAANFWVCLLCFRVVIPCSCGCVCVCVCVCIKLFCQ